jgi:hypothetical protein
MTGADGKSYRHRATFAIPDDDTCTHPTALRELCVGWGWRLTKDVPRGSSDGRQLTWLNPVGDALHYLEDHRNDVCMLVLVADTPSGLATLREHLKIPLWTESDLLDRAEAQRSPSGLVGRFNTLFGLRSATDPDADRGPDPAALDERWLRLVERMAGHADRNVRRAVMFAVANLVHRAPALAGPILARREVETELRSNMDDFVRFIDRDAGRP